jgi:hypothetical protein
MTTTHCELADDVFTYPEPDLSEEILRSGARASWWMAVGVAVTVLAATIALVL